MEGSMVIMIVLGLAVQVSSLTMKSDKERNVLKQREDEMLGRDIEDEMKSLHPFKFQDSLKHPFKFQDSLKHPFKFQDSLKHPFKFQDSLKLLVKRLAERDHPFGFGIGHTSEYRGKKRSEYSPMMSTHAFHGKRSMRKQEHRDNILDDQNTSAFHGKRSIRTQAHRDNILDDQNTSAFHGKRSIRTQAHRDNIPDDQNTSVFHGKRDEDMIVTTASDNNDNINNDDDIDSPSSTSAFHGKRDMKSFIRVLLNHLERERTKKNVNKQ